MGLQSLEANRLGWFSKGANVIVVLIIFKQSQVPYEKTAGYFLVIFKCESKVLVGTNVMLKNTLEYPILQTAQTINISPTANFQNARTWLFIFIK